MIRKDKKELGIFRCFFKLLPMMFKASPMLFLISMITIIAIGLSLGALTMFQQRFFDNATLFSQHNLQFNHVIFAFIRYIAIVIFYHIISTLGDIIPEIRNDKIKGILSQKIHRKISRIPPLYFEETSRLNDINKAEQGKNSAVWFVFAILTIVGFHIPYFSFMSIYLFHLKPILAVAILFVFLPTIFAQVLRASVYSKLEDQSASLRRQYDYYESCMTSREYYKETRLLGSFRYFYKLYIDSLKLLNKIRLKAHVKTNFVELALKSVAVLGYFGILYLLFQALMNSEITVGAFAAVFASVGDLFGIMEDVVCTVFGNLSRNYGAIRNFLSFLDMEERRGENCEIDRTSDIILKDVCFRYPNAENNAINHVNLTIKNGETIAIVGENGSGKTTLSKLITGIYPTSGGCVYYGDRDIREINNQSLFKNQTAVFQKFQRYQFVLKENITISKPGKAATDMELDKLCVEAGVDKGDSSIYPDGYSTMLSREFDGVDISGGQWQRVAIAKGIFRDHSMIVLDEPTAAIDPLEETRLYNSFMEMFALKTALIVTHRLGSVKLADRIVVLHKGGIMEIGTHEELIARHGTYARMYSEQQKWYVD